MCLPNTEAVSASILTDLFEEARDKVLFLNEFNVLQSIGSKLNSLK